VTRLHSTPPNDTPAPLHHPHYETAKARQYRAFQEEVRADIARSDAQRARLTRARVLEAYA
jgi:hypothetical protein